MFFALTNIILDISFGVIWWTTKNTTCLLYYGIRKIVDNHPIMIGYDDNSDNNDNDDNDDNDEKMYFIISEDEYKKLNN